MSGGYRDADLADALALVSRCLLVPDPQVDASTRRGLTAGWDSLAHLAIVTAVERALGRKLQTQEILRVDSVESIARLLAAQ